MLHVLHPLRSLRGRLVPGLFSLCVLSACATVKPSQREYLSRPEMDPSVGLEEEKFHTHVEAAREAGMGGHGAAGGGCGCG